ncbi:MAG: transglutaminase-like domain-containing protein [Candidatus Nezhaarchaeota archaeon]|nr:transglutaminase-like domain-containing protein [Candidatus Nezhaarchaeota archaeon]
MALLDEFLKPTSYARSHLPQIIEFARRLAKPLNPLETIKSIYFFVRDSIKWTIEGVKPEIDVLESRKGVCFNKASLQIALLRASGIPARYRLEEVRSTALKPYLPSHIYELFPERVIHVLAEVYFEGRWLGCDATIDYMLSNPLSKRDWEGGLDLSCIPSAYKLRTVGSYPDLPVSLVLEPIRSVVSQRHILSEIDENLEKMRAMSPTEKLRIFSEHWKL